MVEQVQASRMEASEAPKHRLWRAAGTLYITATWCIDTGTLYITATWCIDTGTLYITATWCIDTGTLYITATWCIDTGTLYITATWHQYVLSVSSYKISHIDDILHLFCPSFHFAFLFNLTCLKIMHWMNFIWGISWTSPRILSLLIPVRAGTSSVALFTFFPHKTLIF